MLRSAVACLVPAFLGILTLLLCRPFGADRARNAAIFVITRTALPLAGIRIAVSGHREYLGQRPAVFVVNHQSALDPLVVAAVLERDVQAVARDSLRRHPVTGPLLRLAGTLFVARDAGRGGAQLAPALASLARGQAVALAPEGTRSTGPDPGPFRPGCIWLATHAQVPLIPIVIHNSFQLLGKGELRIRAGIIKVTVLEPCHIPETTPDRLRERYREVLDTAGRDQQ